MYKLNGTVLLNWGYFLTCLLIIAWTVHLIWCKAQSPTKKDDEVMTSYQKERNEKLQGIHRLGNYLWRKSYKESLLIIFLIISWIILFADNFLPIDPIPAKEELSALMLLATTTIVFWYTRESYDQKRTMQEQKKILKKQTDITEKLLNERVAKIEKALEKQD